MKNLLVYILVGILFLFSSMVSRALADTITSQLESVLNQLGSEDKISVIVSLRDKADIHSHRFEKKHIRRSRLIRALKRKAEITQKPLWKLLKQKGIRRGKNLWLINSISVQARASTIHKLAQHQEVAEIRLDQTLHSPQTMYTLAEEVEWNLNRISAPELWNLGFTGQGIVVATMDTGADLDHPDVNLSWRGGTNSWKDVHNEHPLPFDSDGHGTQALGIVVGASSGGTSIGVAPGAQWIAVKIFDDAGETLLSKIHEGFQWLLDPDGDPNTDDAPDVVNNSWGFSDNVNECILEFYEDIEVLKAASIAVVFSAGNNGPSSSTSISPANYDNAFSVGSTNSSDIIANSSSRGPSACNLELFPQVTAPGVGIKTADLTSGGVFPNSYAYVSGTSFAAPHVSGAMALLMEAFPTLSLAELEDKLILSAEDLGPVGADYDYGHGLINLIGAYELLENSFCSADFNRDESVDLLDLEILTTEWLGINCTNCRSDLNGDHKIDFCDYAAFANHYKQADYP